MLRLILNILWLILGGLVLALMYAIAGVICFILIVTIPFGVASFRMANYCLWPFGRTVIPKPSAGIPSAIGTYTFAIGAVCFDGSIHASKTIQVTSPPKQIDITSMVQFKQSAILHGRTTDLGSVTITNTGSKWIAAPIPVCT